MAEEAKAKRTDDDGYHFKAPDFHEWLRTFGVEKASLLDAFMAGDRKGADDQRGDIFHSLDDLDFEASESGETLIDVIKADLRREQDSEFEPS